MSHTDTRSEAGEARGESNYLSKSESDFKSPVSQTQDEVFGCLPFIHVTSIFLPFFFFSIDNM